MKKTDYLLPEYNRVNSGFTLVELLLALGIAGMISAFAISISSSISGLSKQAMTKVRMETIAAKARQYYRSHKVQAEPVERTVETNKTTWSVPVGSSAFNLEAKYRLDGWGHFLYYRVFDKNDLKNISGFELKSSSVRYGAVIISSGPNQMFGPRQKTNAIHPFVENIKEEESDFEEIYSDSAPVSPHYVVAVNKSDDIILWVNFNQEATEIALEDLQVLQSKVAAFDAQFEGINNGGTSSIDEDGCSPYSGVVNCYDGSSVVGAVPDPNCGRATLDEIEKKTFTCDCNEDGVVGVTEFMNACCFLKKMFGLSDRYETDPWNNPYEWGGADSLKHHKFWSRGPDGGSVNEDTADDIVY